MSSIPDITIVTFISTYLEFLNGKTFYAVSAYPISSKNLFSVKNVHWSSLVFILKTNYRAPQTYFILFPFLLKNASLKPSFWHWPSPFFICLVNFCNMICLNYYEPSRCADWTMAVNVLLNIRCALVSSLLKIPYYFFAFGSQTSQHMTI